MKNDSNEAVKWLLYSVGHGSKEETEIRTVNADAVWRGSIWTVAGDLC